MAKDSIANEISKKTIIQDIFNVLISTASAEQKANKVDNNASTPIPSAPLYHLIKAKFGSHDSFNTLQNAINYLDKKAKKRSLSMKMKKNF